MCEFYPPCLNPQFVRLWQSFSFLIGYFRYRVRLEIQPGSLDRLVALRDHRLLLLPNHPTFQDWIALFLFSARLGELFHYMAAYERFKGTGGRFLQQLGAYSIRRGLGDRPSIAYTINLLMQPHCRLVIFPEGGCSFQNDTVMPFRAGAIQVAFQAMSKLVKHGESVPDFYAVPISLKYRYTDNMTNVIDQTLTRLEKALHIPPDSDFYKRLDRIGNHLLLALEQEYGLAPADTLSLSRNERISHIKTYILQQCEDKLGITSSPQELVRERVYRIQHMLESRADSWADDVWTYDAIHRAAERLLNFDAIYDGYVAADPTPERFLDTLIRMERAVFRINQPAPKGHRRVMIEVGTPLNLKDYFPQYQGDRSGTITLVTQSLQQTVQDNLDHLRNKNKNPRYGGDVDLVQLK
jgi:hypothetical protein